MRARSETPSPHILRLSGSGGSSAAGGGNLFHFKVQAIHQLCETKRAHPYSIPKKTEKRVLREVSTTDNQFGKAGVFLEALRGAKGDDTQTQGIIEMMNAAYSSDGHHPSPPSSPCRSGGAGTTDASESA